MSRLEHGQSRPSEEDVSALARILNEDLTELREHAGFPVDSLQRLRNEEPEGTARLMNAMWVLFAQRLTEAGVDEARIPRVIREIDTETMLNILEGKESLTVREIAGTDEIPDIVREVGDPHVVLVEPSLTADRAPVRKWSTVFRSSEVWLRIRGDISEQQREQMELAGNLIQSIVEPRRAGAVE